MARRSMNRLFVEDALQSGTELTLGDEQSHYVRRVLRLKPDDELILFDGRGGEFTATISANGKHGLRLRIGEHTVRDLESPLLIHLLQGISRGERMDLVVQKATELGVRRITPVLTEFSVVRLDDRKREKRSQHWLRVARSACEQCGRNSVPVIERPCLFEDCMADAGDQHLRLMLQPRAGKTLAEFAPPQTGIELLIGPEGGLSDREIEQAIAAGYAGCSFGPRTLRTETAAIAAIAVLQARWGDLGG